MSSQSAIEWTDATWNPVRGCTKISPGCAHCYAETFAERFRNVPGHPYERGFDLRLVPEKLGEPLTWATPKMVFVNSMSDLFHIPQGTHHGRACSRLVRYGKDPKVEVFWDQLSNTHYERLTWVDKTIWVKSDEIDRLKQSAKGKRKPFPVKITEVTPPEGMVLIGAIETR